MKTFKITRIETIRDTQIVKAKNKEDAMTKMNDDIDYDNWNDAEVVCSDIDEVEEVK